MANTNIEAIRGRLTKAQVDLDKARAAFKAAERRTRTIGRELVAALAADLDLSASERRAMGLRAGASK